MRRSRRRTGSPRRSCPAEPGGVDETAPNEYATGVVIDPQGYILTNYHVLGDPAQNDYQVWVNRRPFKALGVQKVENVTAGDPWTDLAVLKIEAADLEPIAFGDTKDLRKGQIVIALGNPYGMAKDGQVSASWGIISNLGRPLPTAGASIRSGEGVAVPVRRADPDRRPVELGHQRRGAGEPERRDDRPDHGPGRHRRL